jgi:K(+)-stimulated pyrophosphate-energized sodium pump
LSLSLLNVIPVFAGILGLIWAGFLAFQVLKKDPGDAKMQKISKAIQEGAMAFLKREYSTASIFIVFVAVVIGFAITAPTYGLQGPATAIAYVFGAIFSAAAGYVGMTIATRANSRTAHAAKKGLGEALDVAFKGGAVMGFTVAGLGLLGLSVVFLIINYGIGLDKNTAFIIAGFGLGASTIALFARVGGGIFTKAADVGADLVGKVEAGIPEDDPRNPAVIADNVGDNVGDVAGMGADLYESYVGSIVAPITIGAILIGPKGIILPLLIASVGIVASILATFFVRAKEGSNAGRALSLGTYSAAVLSAAGTFGLVWFILGPAKINFVWSVVVGLAAGMAIGQLSEMYTSDKYSAVKEIAEASETGPATNILAGLSTGMYSTMWSILVLVAAIIISFLAGESAMAGGGIYGIALSAVGMLSTTAIVVSVDAYGPIADNAGGIAEMSGQPHEVREITDSLDSVGNTTAAIAKGFAVASAAVTALALFKAFSAAVGLASIDINHYQTVAGMFLGGMIPFFFSAVAIKAVGRAAYKMIGEVRRQFKEIPGLKEGKEGAEPDYASCVDISTKSALREMVLPSVVAVISPILIGLWSTEALGGFLASALVVGFLMAIMMANAGGAWDNAKKYIEAGNLGGKGTATHAAAVCGDTVGDPFKDTAGPCMNIMIKVMTVVALVFAPLFLSVSQGGGILKVFGL